CAREYGNTYYYYGLASW
nr:immunoglobulin heavy chain junction region [Macaca mulatta]MOX94212.1 immunoglobulin heavy chain junction region [Macaca mulatta]